MRALLGSLLFLFLIVGSSRGETWAVSDTGAIQQAIIGDSDGDTVLIGPGTYNEDIDFIGRAIVLMSSDGPEVTIIHGISSGGAVVTFQNGEDSTSVLRGFTIKGQYSGGWGGGISCLGTSPIIEGNIIRENFAGFGSGIYVYESDASILNNTISLNDASQAAGIGCQASSPIIAGNTIKSNGTEYTSEGGGIFLYWGSSPTISYNTIMWNRADDGGGILSWPGCQPIIEGNVIYQNFASDHGGGLYCVESSPTIINNTFMDNYSDYWGSDGAYFNDCYSPSIT